MKYIIGLDVSTTATGICVMDTGGNLHSLNVVKHKVSTKETLTLNQKADEVRGYLKQYVGMDVVDIYIENPLMGSNNAFTVATLLKYNGMITRDCYNIFNVDPKHYTLNEVRKQFLNEYVTVKGVLSLPKGMKSPEKKELVRKKVELMEPAIVWELNKNGKQKDGNLDMSDAYCVTLGGMVINKYPVLIPKLLL